MMTNQKNIAANRWQKVLEQTRKYNHEPKGEYDLRKYWRGMAYRRHKDQPEQLVRARAFSSVLENVTLNFYSDELIAGSRVGFVADKLPAGISQAEYKWLNDEYDRRGQRIFWVGVDHAVPDYPELLEIGIEGYVGKIHASLEKHSMQKEQNFLQACLLAMQGLSAFILRHAKCKLDSGDSSMGESLEWISLKRPRTFHEAMQLVWMVHIAFVSEGRVAMALGRLDQYLLPFYERDLERGILTRESALELTLHLWAKIEELGEVTNITIGGLTAQGKDATNELSYILLEATALALSPHTNLSARLHDKSSDKFHRACFECIRTGVGFPAIFNDHVLIEGLMKIGIPEAIARDHCMVGCIETYFPGRQPAWSDSRFDTPQVLLDALNTLAKTGASSFDELKKLFTEILHEKVAVHTNVINREFSNYPVEKFPDIFFSALTRDCIGRAKDINDGGAEYPRFHGIAFMGLGTLADSFAAIKGAVFEKRLLTLQKLTDILNNDFSGYENERLMLTNHFPKYGNDNDYVDDVAVWLVDTICRECLAHTIDGGGRFLPALAANVQNIDGGRKIGATPDGRKAFTPLSDAASPYFGCDMNGPTAFLKSVAKPDYTMALSGTVINMKFEPEHFEGEIGAARFLCFTKIFVKERIQELQFNFTGNEILQKAYDYPEQHHNLVVRISGFSEYFTRLDQEVQQDVIRRRAHA